jgi:hypothetical protein
MTPLDDEGVRVAALEVDRAGATCGARPCWRPIGKPPPGGKGFGGAGVDPLRRL